MNIANARSALASALGLGQKQLAFDLVPGASAPGSVVGGTGSGSEAQAPSGTLPSGGQGASASLQAAASLLQTASGYLGEIQRMLGEMAGIAQAASGGGAQSGASAEFSSLQGQLRGIIGGSTCEIGGVEGSSAAGASFDGAELFGSSGAEVATEAGDSSMPSLVVASPNLRQGALLSLVAQDCSGSFLLAASSPDAATVISSALAQACSAGSALDASQAQVVAASAEADAATGGGAPAIASASDASDGAAFAARSILSQWDTALAASSGQSSQCALGLLQAI